MAVPYARARDRCAVRVLQAWLAAAADPPWPGVPTDAPRRQAHRPAALRPISRAHRQATRHRPPASPRAAIRPLAQGEIATAGAAAGVEERKIANVTRHRNLPVLRGYIRAATAFDDVGEVL